VIMTQEQELLKAQSLFQALTGYAGQAAAEGRRIDEVERELFRRLLEVGRALLAAFAAAHGKGDEGPAHTDAAGRAWRRLARPRRRRYVSVFGELALERFVYGTREGQKVRAVPLDRRLGLPAGQFSYVVEDRAQRMCLKGSFREAAGSLASLLGLRPGVRSLERMNRQVAGHAEPFRRQQPAPPASAEGDLLVVTADGKGVPMRRPPGAPRPPRRPGKGQKAAKKRMAYVGAVYSVAPFARRAGEVVGEVRRREPPRRRPAPEHKRLWAEMTPAGQQGAGRAALFARLAGEVAARDPCRRKRVVCLLDGERWLWEQQRATFPEAVGVLDLFHVLERLWQVAHCFHPEGSRAAERFVAGRLRRLLGGGAAGVIAGLRRRRGRPGLSAHKRQVLRGAVGYLENNREHLRYDEYLRAGYPIGSGVAEGACRHLVKDRMEQAGMRWTVPGARAMLALRAIYLNGDWEGFLDHRIREEQAELEGRRAA
jgi:hypothetical protein